MSREAARAAVADSLGLSAAVAKPEILRFEVLRALTWALTSGTQPVHILRLLNRATSIMSPLLETTDDRQVRSELREGLDALADAGDLVELEGGLWLPATTRIVRLRYGDSHLLVGGIPSRLLP